MFVLNLVCRDPKLRDSVTSDLRRVFPGVLSFSVPEEVNDILFCSSDSRLPNPGAKRKVGPKHQAVDAVRKVNAAVEQATKEKEFVDVAELLGRLNFIL